MIGEKNLKESWELVIKIISDKFGDGEQLNLDAIIYLIGVQEFGDPFKKFKKDEKLNLMHIAICRLLEPYGYYEFELFDEDGWPHFIAKEQLPTLKAGEQTVLMKEAIVQYFTEKGLV